MRSTGQTFISNPHFSLNADSTLQEFISSDKSRDSHASENSSSRTSSTKSSCLLPRTPDATLPSTHIRPSTSAGHRPSPPVSSWINLDNNDKCRNQADQRVSSYGTSSEFKTRVTNKNAHDKRRYSVADSQRYFAPRPLNIKDGHFAKSNSASDTLMTGSHDARSALIWEAFSQKHCESLLVNFQRQLDKVEDEVIKEQQSRKLLLRKKKSFRFQGGQPQELTFENSNKKLKWLDASQKRKLLILRKCAVLLGKYLKKLANVPSKTFEALHANLHDTILDTLQIYKNDKMEYLFHFEKYFDLTAHCGESNSRIKYYTHNLELEEKKYARLLQYIFLKRLQFNVLETKRVIKTMRLRRLKIFFNSWARNVNILHIMRGRRDLKTCQKEIEIISVDVRARTLNAIHPIKSCELLQMPFVRSFVDAHPKYNNVYSQNFLRDATKHVDRTLRWMLEGTTDNDNNISKNVTSTESQTTEIGSKRGDTKIIIPNTVLSSNTDIGNESKKEGKFDGFGMIFNLVYFSTSYSNFLTCLVHFILCSIIKTHYR